MNNKFLRTACVAALALAGAAASRAEFITTESETLRIWAEPITVEADGKTISTLTVYENDVKTYSSFNMVITVPEGITVAKVKQGRETVDDIFLTERGASSHTIACNMLDDKRTIKIISYSIQLDEFYPDDEDGNPLDALFTLGLIASPEMESGEYTCEISDVKFVEVTTDASILPHEPLTFTLTVEGGRPSSLNPAIADRAGEQGYDLNGRRLVSSPKNTLVIKQGQKQLIR